MVSVIYETLAKEICEEPIPDKTIDKRMENLNISNNLHVCRRGICF